jgi:hypothetical protein
LALKSELRRRKNLPNRQYGNENQEQIPLKRRLAGKLHKHRELRREANDTKSTAQRAIARNQRHEGQRYETDGSKGDGTKPTASYTRVVARAITCDWVVM